MTYTEEVIERLKEARVVFEKEIDELKKAISFIDECLSRQSVNLAKEDLEKEIDNYKESYETVTQEQFDKAIDTIPSPLNPNTKHCLYCGKPYLPTNRKGGAPQKYCSKKCCANDRRKKERERIPPKAPTVVTCIVCGKDIPIKENHIGRKPLYCSQLCMNRQYYAQTKQSWVEPPSEPQVLPPDPLKAKLAEIAASCPKPMPRPNIQRDI